MSLELNMEFALVLANFGFWAGLHFFLMQIQMVTYK
jgi:hypothetical protein